MKTELTIPTYFAGCDAVSDNNGYSQVTIVVMDSEKNVVEIVEYTGKPKPFQLNDFFEEAATVVREKYGNVKLLCDDGKWR